MKLILLILTLAVLGPLAKAQIITGGGCMIAGSLCEFEDYSRLQKLDIKDQVADLKEKTKALPGLGYLFEQLQKSNDWYLEERAFNPDMCAPVSISDNPVQFDIVACQFPTEVRVSTAFWKSASAEQKSALILHEMMISLTIQKKLSVFVARKATFLISTQMQNPNLLRQKIADLNLLMLNTIEEDQYIFNFIESYRMSFCPPQYTGAIPDYWRIFSTEFSNERSSFRSDFDILANKVFQNILEKGKNEYGFCNSPDALKSYAHGLIRNLESL